MLYIMFGLGLGVVALDIGVWVYFRVGWVVCAIQFGLDVGFGVDLWVGFWIRLWILCRLTGRFGCICRRFRLRCRLAG